MKRIKSIVRRIQELFILRIKGAVGYARFKGVTVGDNCRIFTTHFGTEPFLIRIGNNVTVTQGVVFLTHDGSTCLFKDHKGRRFYYNSITIGSNVFIGVNAIIMPGVTIEDNVIIGAGSVVTRSVPSGKIVGGNPAHVIGNFFEYGAKALSGYYSEQDLNKDLSYKERIEKIVTSLHKKFLA